MNSKIMGFLAALFALISVVSQVCTAREIEPKTLEIQLPPEIHFGEPFGLSSTSSSDIPAHLLQKITSGASEGKKGLLKFYGQGMIKNIPEAVKYIRQSAIKGYVEASFTLGILTYYGKGVSQSFKAATKWLENSIDQTRAAGDSYDSQISIDAKWILGMIYNGGKGGETDISKAYYYFSDASSRGHGQATFQLGIMYEYGRHVERDYNTAAKLYREAFEENVPEAGYHLGLMICFGRGFKQDFTKAISIFKKAAEDGSPLAMNMLAKLLVHGQGAPIDYEMALFWFSKAVESEDPRIIEEALDAKQELEQLITDAKQYTGSQELKYKEMQDKKAVY